MSTPDASARAPKPAVCLVSGGMDSAVVLAEARAAGFAPRALTVLYGQNHACELEAAERVVAALGAADHRVVSVDLAALGGSSLVGDGAVPTDRDEEEIGAGVPSTYVPARNTVFLSVALGWAETLGATDLFVGVNALDYSGYPDCREPFLRAFEALADEATAAGAERGARFRVHAPLLEMTKREIVLRAEELDVDLGLTHTCYAPVEDPAGGRALACGKCDACLLRLKGFREAGRVDPVPYASASGGAPAPRSALAGIPANLSHLERATRLSERATATGFRWPDAGGALAKVEEEVLELRAAFDAGDTAQAEAELGDLLMASVFFANYAQIGAERAMRDALRRFEGRFRAMEAALGKGAREATLEEWMAAWRAAKRSEAGGASGPSEAAP